MDIRNLRKKLNLSQQALANETNISKAKIEKWETNKAAPKVEDYLTLRTYFNIHGVLENEDDSALEVQQEELSKEAQLASIMSNIKLDYLVAIVAEIQEKVDSQKIASITVSKIQMLAQADFESKLNKLKI